MSKVFLVAILILGAVYLAVLLGYILGQRRLVFLPSHCEPESGLDPWVVDGQLIGYQRKAVDPRAAWLLLHGNAGQAADRTYALPPFPPGDAVHVLEYPGYGSRPGRPSKKSFNAAAEEGLGALRRLYPELPVGVVAESLGSGPAGHMGGLAMPPDKIVLVVPFDELADVAADLIRLFPVRPFLLDNWRNAEALKAYRGPIEIFAATRDEVIPVRHARRLAGKLPGAVYHEFDGLHGDWSTDPSVRFRYP